MKNRPTSDGPTYTQGWCASCKDHGDVLCVAKALNFSGEIKKQFDTYVHVTLPDLSSWFSVIKQQYFTVLY